MIIDFESRRSSSPFVECIWRSSSRYGGPFLSMAEGNIELVITKLPALVAVTIRGPVSRGTLVECPPNGEWFAIRFRLGTFLPSISTAIMMDHRNLNLPVTADGRFWFAGRYFEIPSFENAEQLVCQLALAGLITRSSVAEAVNQGDVDWLSRRTVQRHFQRATGMTLSSFNQIERARRAASMLLDGSTILEVTFDAGYFDQAHLTRSLDRLIGITPAALQRERPQLSFSYKTTGI